MKHTAVYLFVVAAVVFMVGCGGKTNQQPLKGDSTEVSFSEGDSVVIGYAGAECTDSVLDLIQPPSDPQHFSTVKARRNGNIVGNFLTGDRVAVVLSADKKRVLRAIDISSLIGKWLTGDSINDPAAHGFNLNEDGYASTISKKMDKLQYKNWDIRGARLVLTKCDAMLATPVMYYDTLDIISLEGDTLVLRLKGTREKVRYVKSVAKK